MTESEKQAFDAMREALEYIYKAHWTHWNSQDQHCVQSALTAAKEVQTQVQPSDLVKRLRGTASKGVSVWGDLQMEAAKEIEILTAEREAYASAMDRMKKANCKQCQTPNSCGGDGKCLEQYIKARQAQQATPQAQPVMTKTWFEDGELVTQHLTADDVYKPPAQRLTDREVIALLPQDGSWVRFARAIELAFAAKNGITLQE